VDKDAVPLVVELTGELSLKETKGSESTPQHFSLYQNYPNPFNPTTVIRYSVSSDDPIHTTLRIYNTLGQKVKTLVNESKGAGDYEVIWDGKNDQGKEVTSGVYFYRLEADRFSEVKKMILVK